MSQLPDAFLRRSAEILSPPDFQAMRASQQSPPVSVRWTGPADQVGEAQSYLSRHDIDATAVDWHVESWQVAAQDRQAMLALPWVIRQRLFPQSLSSIAAVLGMDVRPGMDVLDLCAAPGGKTSLIRREQHGQGVLVANELSRARAARLSKLLSTHELTGVDVQIADGRTLGSRMARCFDCILADVPCSGEGRFVDGQPARWASWSEGTIKGLARRQISLLDSACQCLRIGGSVLYATCTMAPEENEGVIHRLLTKVCARRGIEMEAEPITLSLPQKRPARTSWKGVTYHSDVSHAIRIVAGGGMTPFFLAKLRRLR